MNMYKKILYVLFISLFLSCTHGSKTDKYQYNRDNVFRAKEKVKEIVIPENDVLIGAFPGLFILNDYLIIRDSRSTGKLIHIFNKNTFKYITSVADKGQGPGEIANIGNIACDEANRKFYVSDHGKQEILSYDLDSVLINPLYLPKVKMKIDKGFFPDRYQYISDTLSYCRTIEITGNNDYQDGIGIFNMSTGEIKEIGNKHPNLNKNRINVSVSVENCIYVEYSYFYDLFTICSLNGDLKYSVYGPNWSNRRDGKDYFGKVVFIKNNIFASYGQGNLQTNEYIPTKFLIFNVSGDYLLTIEPGYWITDFCYDKGNNRVIMALNEAKMQFAYLNLNGIMEN